MFCKKDVRRNFTKFTGKHLCQSFSFNKVTGVRPATLLKKRLCHRCFPVNFAKFLRTPFLTEHLWWLLPVTANSNSKMPISLDMKRKKVKNQCLSLQLFSRKFKAIGVFLRILGNFPKQFLKNTLTRLHLYHS